MNPATFFNVPGGDRFEDRHRGAEVLLSQKGTIDRVEFMAVDKHGNLDGGGVPTCVSVWWARVGNRVSPRLPDSPDADPKGRDRGVLSWTEGRQAAQGVSVPRPRPALVQKGKAVTRTSRRVGRDRQMGRSFTRTTAQEKLYVGWGNHYEQAGYWPSSSRLTDTRPGCWSTTPEWGTTRCSARVPLQ